MNIVNLTPHAIVVRLADGTDRTFPPSGGVCRCTPIADPALSIDGIPTVMSSFGPLSGLPRPVEGTIYLVSAPAAQKAAQIGRGDVCSPDTGPTAIRQPATLADGSQNPKAGQVVAVLGFQRF